jgi:hypothetical protein
MSNLYNQNIGINYKGILNLDTTINTPLDATLRAVTDGMGTSSPLQLSTDQVGISRTVALSAGATNPRLFNEVYTINNSGAQTGALTGFFLNATETALNGITHNLMDLQVGGVSKVKVNNIGSQTLAYSLTVGSSSAHYIQLGVGLVLRSATDGQATFLNGAETGFTRINLGGTTSSFPAIKRNGAVIDFRLADDSGYANVTGQELGANVGFFAPNSTELRGTYLRARSSTFIGFADSTQGIVLDSSATTPSASAILQTNSTTKGFLPPRMTYAQMKAIASPATGLQVYNTDNNTPQVYDGTGYQILGTSVVTGTISAGATTLSCDNGNIFALTLVNGTPTAITLNNARPSTFVINLKQPAGGSATVTWTTTIVWAGGTAPTLTTTANYIDIVTLIYDGTTWRGTATLNFAS